MKKKNIFTIIIIFIIAAFFFFFSFSEERKNARINAPTLNDERKQSDNYVLAKEVKNKVIVYYFHISYRCSSCFKIEQYSAEAVNAGFPKELKNGKIVWKVINAEEAQNRHFIKDYQLYTKSLVIVKIKNGKQAEWKNLNKVWEFFYDKNKFIGYVQDEIKSYLKGN